MLFSNLLGESMFYGINPLIGFSYKHTEMYEWR